MASSPSEADAETVNQPTDTLMCLCKAPLLPPLAASPSNHGLVQCNFRQSLACHQFVHPSCVEIRPDDASRIERYACAACSDSSIHRMWDKHGKEFNPRPIRNRAHVSYALMETAESSPGEEKWTTFLDKCRRKELFSSHPLEVVQGAKVTSERLAWHFSEPFIVHDPLETLDMHLPQNLTYETVAETIGADRQLSVIDVASQGEVSMTLGEWVKALKSPYRPQIFNLISLEFSGTPLAQQVTRPRAVRDLDLVDLHWPSHRADNHDIPCVKLYCLMSMAKSWTDFHIDMGGTSVFYHIVHGSKTFYFIRPTSTNLEVYNAWMNSDSDDGLMRRVNECWEVHASAGQTLFIPSGWIHAVFTPSDSLVIGGNFLQAREIDMQIQIHTMEKCLDVPDKCLFPMFSDVQWYTAAHYATILGSHPDRIDTMLAKQLLYLAVFLFDNHFSQMTPTETSPCPKLLLDCSPPNDLARDPFSVVTMLTLGSLQVLSVWQRPVPSRIQASVHRITSTATPLMPSTLPYALSLPSTGKKRSFPQELAQEGTQQRAPPQPSATAIRPSRPLSNPRAQLPVVETSSLSHPYPRSTLVSTVGGSLSRLDASHIHPAQVRLLEQKQRTKKEPNADPGQFHLQ